MILSNYAIKFRTAVFVLVVVLVLAGVSSYMRLPREGSPDITIPNVFITTIYEGTAPSEMEKLVTIPLEKTLNDLENVKEIRSTSAESLSSISIEFTAGEDIDFALQRVKNKVDLAKPDLPNDLDEPVVQGLNISTDFAIFTFALSGQTDPERLRMLAEDIQEELELVKGVKQVSLAGVREREIRVEIDMLRLAAYKIPLGLVMGRIATENSTVSAGNIEVEGGKFQVRVPGEFKQVDEIRNLVLLETDGRPVYLRDVARVSDTFKDRESISRLDGEPCVSLDVKKRSGENSVKLIDRVKERLDDFELPAGVTLTVVMDESDYVDMMIAELENNVFTGFLLVVAVLLVFMGGRNSLFVAAAIPLSMLIAFAVLSAMGTTLNMIVLFSLVLSVGMLVDNAIVIVENIYRHRQMGESKIESARHGTAEVAWPVITSTFTTIAAFSPLLFWPDIIGQFMSFLPRTLIVTLSSSLFVAMMINPAVCSALISRGRPRNAGPTAAEPRGGVFVNGYERLLRGALARSLPVLLLGFLTLVFTVLVYQRFGKEKELFPEIEPRNARVEVSFPQGTGIDHTDRTMKRIESRLEGYEDIEFILTRVGAGSGDMWAIGGGTHQGSVHIEFVEKADRQGNTTELVGRIRDELGGVPGAEIRVEKQREGPPVGAPVTIELSGDDFKVLSRLAGEIRRSIKTVPGLVDLKDDIEEALPELQFRVDRQRAALLGLDTDTIGLFLRTGIYGIETSKFRSDENEFDITLRFPPEQRNTLDLLGQAVIPVAGGRCVPLSSLGEVVYAGGRGAISRKDRKRVVTISGNIRERSVDEILADVRGRVAKLTVPRGYALTYAGDTQEMQESGAFLGRAFLIALGLILVILVIQFNSLVLPLIIICSVVLSLIGVMWGLLICRLPFGVIMTGLGVISLAGIVVNNAIVLVDCIRQRQSEGLPTLEAVVEAGRLRLRPVLLTAITTILGLIPMAAGYSLQMHEWPPRIIAGAESSDWWAPMAVAVIFGLGVATVMTLVLVPVMYAVADSVAVRARNRFGVSDD